MRQSRLLFEFLESLAAFLLLYDDKHVAKYRLKTFIELVPSFRCYDSIITFIVFDYRDLFGFLLDRYLVNSGITILLTALYNHIARRESFTKLAIGNALFNVSISNGNLMVEFPTLVRIQ